MVSAELDSNEQHEDEVDAGTKETLVPVDSEIIEDVEEESALQVELTHEEAQPSEDSHLRAEPIVVLPEAPTSSPPTMDQEDQPSSSSEPIVTKEPDSAETRDVKTEEPTVATAPVPTDEPQTNSIPIAPPMETEINEQQSIVELEEIESTKSRPKATFVESLTANFADDTKVMWAQIFGPRYDDGDEDEVLPEASEPDTESSKSSSKSSLQAKLTRERKLDEQIQASQQRYRERVMRETATKRMTTRRGQPRSSRRSQTQIPTMSPFERAGLSLTQIRFCTEKALDETCKCFHHLHAAALEEPDPDPSLMTRGIYVTQRELEQLLHELLDPQEAQRRETLTGVVDFSNGLEEKIPMAIQLQASWFLPFGQLPELRTLVMKITKRHLSEDKLAILNRHLQKQLTVLPLAGKLQHLVLQLSNYQLKESLNAPIWLQGKKSPDELAQDLLKGVGLGSMEVENFLPFLPVDLVAKTQLPSVVSAQRLVFFRFLVDIVAMERMRVDEKSTESLPPAREERPTRRKSIRRRSTKRTSVNIVPDANDCNSKEKATESVQAVPESFTDDTVVGFSEPVGDECEKPSSHLQHQLEEAIAKIRQRVPAIESDVSQDPAIRATYLAAVACHKSVLLMVENNIDVDAMADQLRHFIDALQVIETQESAQTVTATTTSQLITDDELPDPPKFPPPYPESAVPEEENYSESSTKPNFPPPYAITAPSYWTFTPTIPEPKSSIAKLASKSPSNKAEFRCLFMSKDSPGVGAYNIEQSEKSTFQHKPSYSFGGNKTPERTLSKGSIGKQSLLHQRMKTSLAFASPIADNEVYTADVSSTRVHTGSIQYNINSNEDLLREMPPDYNNGDADEPPEENPQSVETEMDRALRQQQQIFMDEFVQHVVSNQEPPAYFVPRAKEKSKSKPYWATSEVSPGIERLLHRQRRTPTTTKFRPAQTAPVPNTVKPRPPKRVVNKAPPPRQQLDNDQHLAWAARISELYHPEK